MKVWHEAKSKFDRAHARIELIKACGMTLESKMIG